MTAVSSISDLVNRNTGGNSGTPESIFLHKRARVSGVDDSWTTGLMYSTWRYEQTPGPGATPGAVAVPTNATTGAIPITNASGGRTKWLVAAAIFNSSPLDMGLFILYDRLLHKGGLSATSTSVQNIQASSGVALTRYTGGVGNQIWVEVYTAIGSTPQTLTITYTNQAGTGSKTTTTTFGGTGASKFNEANSILNIPLAAGDTGVQSVESVQLGGSTGTAGDFGVTIAHPLSIIGESRTQNFMEELPGLITIPADACLGIIGFADTGVEGFIVGQLSFVEA